MKNIYHHSIFEPHKHQHPAAVAMESVVVQQRRRGGRRDRVIRKGSTGWDEYAVNAWLVLWRCHSAPA